MRFNCIDLKRCETVPGFKNIDSFLTHSGTQVSYGLIDQMLEFQINDIK